jgi:hypothetical protein
MHAGEVFPRFLAPYDKRCKADSVVVRSSHTQTLANDSPLSTTVSND